MALIASNLRVISEAEAAAAVERFLLKNSPANGSMSIAADSYEHLKTLANALTGKDQTRGHISNSKNSASSTARKRKLSEPVAGAQDPTSSEFVELEHIKASEKKEKKDKKEKKEKKSRKEE